MIDPTLTVTVSRTSLSLPALVLSATHDGTPLGLVEYQPPAWQQRVRYAPDSDYVHGSEPIAAAWQESMLNFSFMADESATEAELQASVAQVRAALAQFSYTVTTKVSDAPAEVWTARPGSLIPPDRTYADLVHLTAVYAVSIPVYPIPS